MKKLAYVAYSWYLRVIFVADTYGYSMVKKVAVHCFVRLICAVIWGLHVGYIYSEVGYIYLMGQAYKIRGMCQ